MRMIATLISDGLCRAMHERWRLDPADYARRLHELPGDWPSPQAHRPY
jgi:hypothetical protein